MSNKIKISIIAVGAVVVAGIGFSGGVTLPSMNGGGDAVAIVNGEEISRQDFNLYKEEVERELLQGDVEQMSREDLERIAQSSDVGDTENMSKSEMKDKIVEQTAINRLVERTLLLQAAREAGFELDEEEVQRQYDQAVENLGGEEQLQQSLKESNLSEEKLRRDLGEHLMIQQFVKSEAQKEQGEVSVTDEEVREQYDQVAEGQEGVPPFEAVKDQLKSQISQQKENQNINAFVPTLVSELRADADVEIRL